MSTERRQIDVSRPGSRVIFVTGATGNIGAVVTASLLRDDPQARLVLLVRAQTPEAGRRRVEQAIAFLSPQTDVVGQRRRIRIVVGDITHARLGLGEVKWNKLASRVTEIIHAAASTKFLLPLPCAREINCRGTANVLDLALAARRRGRLRLFVHVSTAFVCGNRSGEIFEHDTDRPRKFSNSYEHTKWEGEQLVRSLMSEIPITIVRPSIVVGDSHTGRILTFNVLYTPLRMIYEGKLPFVPGKADADLDVVPLDYVADAIAHLTLHSRETVGRTFHLTAGAGRTLSAGEIVGRSAQIYAGIQASVAPRKCRFVSPWLGRLMGRFAGGRRTHLWHLAEPFVVYLSAKRQFDTHNADAILGRCGIRPPAFADYLSTILTCAVDSRWGRHCHRGASAA